MSRTVPSFAEEGLKRFLHGMDRRVRDLERLGDWRFDTETDPDSASVILRNAAHLLCMSVTVDSITSGGDYVAFDTIESQFGFADVGGAGASWTHPVSGVYVLTYEHVWAAHTAGGIIEVELDGAVRPECVVADGTDGQYGQGVIIYTAASGQIGKVKVTQSSGSDQTCDAFLRVAIPDPLGEGIAETLVPFESSGWSYTTIDRTDDTDYSAPAFDDSGWSVGTAIFGATTRADFERTITTPTSLDVRTWLRREIIGSFTSVTVTVMGDNEGEAWWNGTYLGTFTFTGVLTGDTQEFIVPAAARTGTSHVLAVRITDDATTTPDNHYADAKVEVVRAV